MTIAKRRTGVLLFALLVVAMLAASCSSSKKSSDSSSSSSSSSAADTAAVATGGTVKVAIKNFSFKPSSVKVKVGQSVQFTNDDPTTHTATATNNGFDTGNLDSGKSKTVTFSKPGTYQYICSIHNYMKGTITVTS